MKPAQLPDADSFITGALGRVPAANREQALEIGTGQACSSLGCRFGVVQMVQPAALADLPPGQIDFILCSRAFNETTHLEIVVTCFRESARLLRHGGLLCMRLNNLPDSTTRFSSGELQEMARDLDFQILTIDGVRSKSMWILWRKRAPGWRFELPDHAMLASVTIRRIANAWDNEPIVPGRGRYASIAIQVEGLPVDMDLLDLEILVGGARATATSIGELTSGGLQDIHALLPSFEQTGLVPVELRWFGERLTPAPSHLRIIPPGPSVPHIVEIAAGATRMAGITVSIEELSRPGEFSATINGQTLWASDAVCTDPVAQRYDVRFQLPEELPSGVYEMRLMAGRRKLAPVSIEIE
jgi:hypothetical protein